MTRQIVIKLPEWIDDDTIEEAFEILLKLELEKKKSPKGLLEELEKLKPRIAMEDIEKFLKERR